MKTCPKCGELNGDNSAACFKCGAKLETAAKNAAYQKKCPKCGRIYDAKEELCAHCPDTPLAVYAPVESVYTYVDRSSSFWINCLRIIAGISFVVLVIVGIVNGVMTGGLEGFFSFLGSFVIALVSLAAVMVFLDMATDVRTIKNALSEDGEE